MFSLSLNLHFPDDWWCWFFFFGDADFFNACVCLLYVIFWEIQIIYMWFPSDLVSVFSAVETLESHVWLLTINLQKDEKSAGIFSTFCVLSLCCIDCFCFIQPHALNSWTSVQPFELFSGSSILTLLAPPNCHWLIHMLSNELFFHRHGLLILAAHSFCLSQSCCYLYRPR